MTLSVSRDMLREAIADLSRVVPSRSPMELYRCVQMHSRGTHLCIRGTSGEVSLKRIVPCDGEMEDTLVPFSLLQGAAQALRADTITMRLGSRLQLKGGGDISLNVLASTLAFPSHPDVELQWRCAGDRLKQAVMHTSPVTGVDTRFAFGSVAVVTGESARLESSSGKSAAYHLIHCEGPGGVRFLIPNKPLKCIEPMIGSADVEFGCNGSVCRFSSDEWDIVATTSSGRFPDILGYFTKCQPDEWMTVKEKDLRDAFATVSFMASAIPREKDIAPSMEIAFQKTGMLLSVASSEVGKAESFIECECPYEGSLRFQCEAIREMLRSCEGPLDIGVVMSNVGGTIFARTSFGGFFCAQSLDRVV